MSTKPKLTPLERRVIESLVDGDHITHYDLGIKAEELASVVDQIRTKYGIVIQQGEVPIH